MYCAVYPILCKICTILIGQGNKKNLNLDIFMYNSYNALVGKSKCEQNPFENVVFFILFSANVLIYTFLQPQFFFFYYKELPVYFCSELTLLHDKVPLTYFRMAGIQPFHFSITLLKKIT